MITAAVLFAYAASIGLAVPHLLARARWPQRAPRLAVLAWLGLMLAFVLATALAVYHLALTEDHVHEGLIGLLSACGLSPRPRAAATAHPTYADAAELLAPLTILLLPAGWWVHALWRARRERRAHARMLAMVGTAVPAYGVTLLEHSTPAVYCLPGRTRRVVITRGALDALTEAQLLAVLEHEKSHIRGRHHLLHAATDAFARTFPGLPLARAARDHLALLVEMLADDGALRRHSRDALASAMCEVAAGRTPRGALGSGGRGAMVRMRRILSPTDRPHPAAWLGVVLASVGAPFLPLLIGCVP